MKPTIGVIVSCYNYAQYVGIAIDSILAQSRPADEIIVVDDGSTDGSRAVINRYGDKVRALFQPNAGHVAARNNGFLASRSDIVVFLDADDRLLPNALAEIERLWQPRVCKVQFDLYLIDASGARLGRRCCHFPVRYPAADVANEFRRTGSYRWPVTSGNAYARWFIAPLMPMQPPQSQDGILNTLAPLYGEIVTAPEPLGEYRVHGRSVSRGRVTAARVGYPDFARRIAIRHAEFAVLQEHAQMMNVRLPAGDPLDREIVFVNYRLMARKMRESYEQHERDSNLRLAWLGLQLAWRGAHPLRVRLAHTAWFCALLLCPAPLAKPLVELRFNRSHTLLRWKRAWRELLGVRRPESRGASP